MKSIEQATSRELEIEQLKRAIVRGEQALCRAQQTVHDLHERQLGRMKELGIQETLLQLKTEN